MGDDANLLVGNSHHTSGIGLNGMKQLSLPGNTRQITVTFQVNAIGREMSRRL